MYYVELITLREEKYVLVYTTPKFLKIHVRHVCPKCRKKGHRKKGHRKNGHGKKGTGKWAQGKRAQVKN